MVFDRLGRAQAYQRKLGGMAFVATFACCGGPALLRSRFVTVIAQKDTVLEHYMPRHYEYKFDMSLPHASFALYHVETRS